MQLFAPGTRSRRWFLPWCLAMALLANLAYPMYVHYDFSHSLDTRGYLRMATGRFDSVSVTRRYRILVPAAAAIVAAPVAKVYGHIWPQRPAGLWPLRFAFYLVNCILLAAAAATWFNTARLSGAPAEAAALAMLAVLSSRWAEYGAGLPLTDSLYLLIFGLSYYACRRGSGAGWAIALSLLLGPLAKESFVFLLPWIFWFGRPALSWPKQAIALIIGCLTLALTHHYIDRSIAAASTETVSNALNHLENIRYSLHRAASPKGIGELLSIFGFFTLIPAFAFFLKKSRTSTSLSIASEGFNFLKSADFWFVAIVAIHMLLSGDLGRMGYLAAPLFVVLLANSLKNWRPLLQS
ncbi:hypothetical protein Q5H93_19815 [Hymenobacter sp. ASUV-10]|uniref:DUF2029 domain-containing protein n=1 Tax=Hymenobacter aranciens TaxID=3063996 RepID=A0ABT9BKE2_9BACT|nr:hypothetical protein [Hymenobacter sp. ASUV-10]MDO7877003.1 hypothetical protein [Hymenobacter sp. ASUV-10]